MHKIARTSTVVLASALALGCAVSTASQASAVGGNCSSAKETKRVSWQPDPSRVRAVCSSLQGDSKAQGELDVGLQPDARTPWFTTLNKSYYSQWYDPPNYGTRVRIERV